MRDPALQSVLALVLAVLVMASIVSESIAFRQRRKSDLATETVQNLVTRVRAWWGMVAVLFLTSLGGRNALFTLYALLSMLALREFLTLTPTHRADHRVLTWVFFLLVPLHYYLAAVGWYVMFLILIPVYAFALIPAHLAWRGETSAFLDRSAKIQWGVLVCVYFVSYVPMLQLVPLRGVPQGSPRLLFFLVLVSQLSDVFQYVFGKLLGRHKIAPSVSPNKTVEGFVLGGGAAVALGGALHFATPFGPLGAIALSTLVVLAGFIGGLVMSAVKRSLGAKDWSAAVPGHGGVLDRLDSLVFSAPVFFHFVVFFADVDMANTHPSWLDAELFTAP